MNKDNLVEEKIEQQNPSHSHNRKHEQNALHSFKELSALFEERFNVRHFPEQPQKLYDASQYLLTVKGKRIRPVMCLMGNELFAEIKEDAYNVAAAIELFHNFTLVHDDIMDRAPLRRGLQTVHTKFGESTALLAGDVMLVGAYEYLNKISSEYIHAVLNLFNSTAKKVCEGQQLDMDFEKDVDVNFDDYVKMIGLKTSVLLAASLQLGAILGGAGLGNQEHLYEFGKNLGIAFQIQDDYLDAFGDPEKFGKKPGGDIMANKKTFLLLQAMKAAPAAQQKELKYLLSLDTENKIQPILDIYKSCNVDEWAKELKQKYFSIAMEHLEEIAVRSFRKKPLQELAEYLMERDV
ncbi:MAG TPA: polyprenyl synthetase family protein [Hanamia sp.]|jgi:geranylgeranyl diphosphate synthase, type II|nr:polyprenyl synthetase family protein [Hanamia sp.]